MSAADIVQQSRFNPMYSLHHESDFGVVHAWMCSFFCCFHTDRLLYRGDSKLARRSGYVTQGRYKHV